MKIIVKDNYEEMSASCAEFICGYINKNPGKLLCFAAGDTPLAIMKKLIEKQEAGEVNLASMYYAGLDEWEGLGYEDKGSCRQVMQDNFYGPAKIACENMRVFDGKADAGEETRAVLDFIKDKSGIGLAPAPGGCQSFKILLKAKAYFSVVTAHCGYFHNRFYYSIHGSMKRAAITK